MTYAEFYTLVEGFLGVEADRKGARTPTKIRQEIEVSIGETCQLIPYYRKGFKRVFNFDDTDVTDVGFASRIKLPQAIKVLELHHVRIGKRWALRPLYEYPWAHRSDLTAGMVTIGSARANMRYSLNPTGGRELLVYPRLTKGYGLMVEFSGVPFRSNGLSLASGDEVPFDNVFANVVALQVRIMIEADLNREPGAVGMMKARHMEARALLASEVNDRVDVPSTPSPADSICMPGQLACVTECGYPCGSETATCTDVEMPQLEWVMFGDSGQRSNITYTKAVAASVNAVNPDLIVHLGDATYSTTDRPGDAVGGVQVIGSTLAGSKHSIYDLFSRHYSGFIRDGKMWFTFGNHDLETGYGQTMLDTISNLADAIPYQKRVDHQLWYSFSSGPVRFIVLNSGIDENDDLIDEVAQAAFVEETIATASESWIVVCFHRPAYTTGDEHYPGSTRMREMCEGFKALGVDLVVNAHNHAYERYMDSSGLLHVACGTGGAVLDSAKVNEDTDVSLDAAGSLRFIAGSYGFLHCTADTDRLSVSFVDTGGSALDSFTLVKS